MAKIKLFVVYFLFLIKIIKKPIKFIKGMFNKLNLNPYSPLYFFLNSKKLKWFLSLNDRIGFFVFHFILNFLSL